jgi:ferric-dicitrate binding protein FerR (iron transport regulator)
MSELDVLRRLGDQILPPPFEALQETARRRARRARAATSLAVAAAVVAVSATTVYLDRGDDRRVEPAPATPTSRPLTYADGSTIHYGDHTVEAGGNVVELDVTDYGAGYRTEDG